MSLIRSEYLSFSVNCLVTGQKLWSVMLPKFPSSLYFVAYILSVCLIEVSSPHYSVHKRKTENKPKEGENKPSPLKHAFSARTQCHQRAKAGSWVVEGKKTLVLFMLKHRYLNTVHKQIHDISMVLNFHGGNLGKKCLRRLLTGVIMKKRLRTYVLKASFRNCTHLFCSQELSHKDKPSFQGS